MPEELAKLRGAGGRPAQAAAKRRTLQLVQRIVPHLRGHQVRHHVAQRDAVQARVVLLQHLELARIEAEPRHAGIDMQDRRQRPPAAARRSRPGVDLGERAEHRNDIVRQVVRLAAGDQATQHREQRVRHQFADRQRLVQQGDEEMPATRRVQRPRRPWRAPRP